MCGGSVASRGVEPAHQIYPVSGNFRIFLGREAQNAVRQSAFAPHEKLFSYTAEQYGYCVMPCGKVTSRGCVVDVSRGGGTYDRIAWKTMSADAFRVRHGQKWPLPTNIDIGQTDGVPGGLLPPGIIQDGNPEGYTREIELCTRLHRQTQRILRR